MELKDTIREVVYIGGRREETQRAALMWSNAIGSRSPQSGMDFLGDALDITDARDVGFVSRGR